MTRSTTKRVPEVLNAYFQVKVQIHCILSRFKMSFHPRDTLNLKIQI